MIVLQNLSFSYKDHEPILQGLNLEILDGEYLGIIGANGSGKTTLIRHFNALLRPTVGEVWVNGLSTRNVKNLPEIRRMIGMIFQNPDNQMVGMTVEEDVAFGPGNLGLPSAEIRRRIDDSLEIVGLSNCKSHPPYTLSGGQKQLLAIAGVLAMDSRFIVLDEPTSSLDPASRCQVLDLLKQLNQQGIGIIHVTHNMDELVNARRILVMEKGRLAADGPPGDILLRVEWLRSLGLAPSKMAELFWYLQQKGLNISPGLFSIKKAGDEIINLLDEYNLKTSVRTR